MRTKLLIVTLLSIVAGGAALGGIVTGTAYLGGDPAVARWAGAAVVLAVIATPLVLLAERTNRRATDAVGGTRVPSAPRHLDRDLDRDTARTLDDLRVHH